MNKFIISVIGTVLFINSAMTMAANKASQSSPAPTTANKMVAKQKSHQNSAVGVWIHQLDVSLFQDLDHDGFYQNLRLNIDLDTNASARDVFVQLWLNAPGYNGTLVYTSEQFRLFGDSYDDAQQIDIQFIDRYQEDYYQLELVIIDQATGLEIFHVDQYDDNKLQDLAIEGQSSDQDQTVSVYSANVSLYNDDNYNGYYHELTVSFDLDVPYGSARLIAEFYLDNELIYTSHAFDVIGSRTSDKQYFDIEMVSGLAAGYYDLDVKILDASDRYQRHHLSAIDWIVFNDLPLESYYWDHYTHNDDIDVHVEQSAGNVGWAALGLIVLVAWRRKH